MENFHFFWNGPFSQWYPSYFTVDGVRYNCAEQYMMASKAKMFDDEASFKAVMASDSPRDQKAIGRKVKNFSPQQWETKCMEIVTTANLAKFSQNEELKLFIHGTGDAVIVEASPYDAIWGIGFDEANALLVNRASWGKNLLGLCLMDVRRQLQSTL